MAGRPNNRKKSVPGKEVLAKSRGKKKVSASKKPQAANDFSFTPKTELGRDLWAIRQRIVASGAELLDWRGVHRELMLRRGGVDSDEE
jgi:hypothetical protein